MRGATKVESSRTHPRESSFVSLLSGWMQQGVDSFFATQRILLDLAMRQNASVMHALRQQLSDPHHSPTALFGEIAGEGMDNFLEGQNVLFDLGKQQNEILMTGVKERVGDWPAAQAMTEQLRRTENTFIHTQQEFLKIAGKQSHRFVEAAKTGKPYQPEQLVDLAREGLENFVKAQKQFLDFIADEVSKATGSKHAIGEKKLKKTELSQLPHQATESFIEAQKKLMNVFGKQTKASVSTAGKAMEFMRPFPFLPWAELTREGVKSYVDAQKALMETVVKPAVERTHAPKVTTRRKKPARATQAAAAPAVA